ncbi:hypothetical protein Z946_3204 [Sulfitobacter noctilucicola]|nr:hypothetical protein Z946_3204 [Sulfitobacter noctilucicola]
MREIQMSAFNLHMDRVNTKSCISSQLYPNIVHPELWRA